MPGSRAADAAGRRADGANATTAMSARDLRDWAARAGADLDDVGVVVTHGAAPRLAHEGSTWVSLSSSRGSGRLVRAADGSSHSRAHRYSDGATLLDDRAPTTERAQLDTLVRHLSR